MPKAVWDYYCLQGGCRLRQNDPEHNEEWLERSEVHLGYGISQIPGTSAMVLIGLGSNQGDSIQLVRQSMQALLRFARGPLLRSSLWRTSPVDCPEGAELFINAVVGFEPRRELTPLSLLKQLKRMEQESGRQATIIRNAPRELDLDLLVFGEVCTASAELRLPHPRAAERLFVLAPAMEVAPDLLWPGLGKTVRELYGTLESDELVQKLGAI